MATERGSCPTPNSTSLLATSWPCALRTSITATELVSRFATTTNRSSDVSAIDVERLGVTRRLGTTGAVVVVTVGAVVSSSLQPDTINVPTIITRATRYSTAACDQTFAWGGLPLPVRMCLDDASLPLPQVCERWDVLGQQP